MSECDRPDGDYLHNCDKCGIRFSGYKGDRRCMVCLQAAEASSWPPYSVVPSFPVADVVPIPRTEIEALRQNAARLHSIHENALCDRWLEECGEVPNKITWERFLELVDEQVEMDAHERTPEFMAEIRAALVDDERRTIEP